MVHRSRRILVDKLGSVQHFGQNQCTHALLDGRKRELLKRSLSSRNARGLSVLGIILTFVTILDSRDDLAARESS